MHGQLTFQTPLSTTTPGDDLTSTSTVRAFVATERVTVVEVGCVSTISTANPGAGFGFTASKRVGADATADVLIDVFKSQFAAEGGVAGDPSILNFDAANRIANNKLLGSTSFTGGKCLRAYCEVTLDKGDMIVFKVTNAGAASSKGAFYAKTYCDGAGLVEANDVESA
jgi:hypothetical protein